jgi:hypothetical protein
MSVDSSRRQPRPDWLPRAIISGFIATAAMAVLFFLAYGLSRVVSLIELRPQRGAAEFTQWMQALTHNQVLDVAATSLYAAAAVHLVVGVLWAILYAYYFEPRLPGEGWAKGMQFALLPWILSLVVFLPLVGGGLFGEAIGAGPLPALGNLILHLGYGITLGVIYGPLGDVPADDLSRSGVADDLETMTHYEQAAARGIVFGAVIGAVVGVAGAVVVAVQPGVSAGIPPLAFVPVSVALGATFGGFIGSVGGLAGAPGHSASH